MFCAATILLFAANGCAQAPTLATASVPPIPPARRGCGFIGTTSLGDLEHDGGLDERRTVGYSRLGGAFYRDVPPGDYHVTPPATAPISARPRTALSAGRGGLRQDRVAAQLGERRREERYRARHVLRPAGFRPKSRGPGSRAAPSTAAAECGRPARNSPGSEPRCRSRRRRSRRGGPS